jgi:hypothetical protein
MKDRMLTLTIISVMLSSIYYGCATKEQNPFLTPGTIPGISRKEGGETLNVAITRGPCTHSYDVDTGGYVKKGTLKVTKGQDQCKPFETDEFYVSGSKAGRNQKVLFMPPLEFKTEGSCWYCYINSAGGMSCVTYSGPFCP